MLEREKIDRRMDKAQKQPECAREKDEGGHQQFHLLYVTLAMDLIKKPWKFTFFKRFPLDD